MSELSGDLNPEASVGPVQVPSVGPIEDELAFVGEAPGKNEVLQGRPFVGAAGKLFKARLADAGIKYNECVVTNVVKRRPAENSNDFSLIPKDELEQWEEILRHTLTSLPNLKLIVPLGNNAFYALMRMRGIASHRGSLYTWTDLNRRRVPLMPTIHPSTMNYDAFAKYVFLHDMRRAKQILEGTYTQRVYNFTIKPSEQDILSFITTAIAQDYLSFDIETVLRDDGVHITHLALSHTIGEAISIELFTPQVIAALRNLFQNPSIRMIAQNAQYDCRCIYDNWGFLPSNMWMDTMIAHHLLYPEASHPKTFSNIVSNSLEYLVSIYTTNNFHKDEGRTHETPEAYAEYNCKDAAYTLELALQLDRQLEDEGVDHYFHDHIMPLHNSLLDMQIRGVRIDEDALRQTRAAVMDEYRACQMVLDNAIEEVFPDYPRIEPPKTRLETGMRFLNVHSSKQVGHFLLKVLNLPPIGKKSSKTGAYGFNEKTLTKYARKHGGGLFQLLFHMRKLDKQREVLDKARPASGRFHCHYKQSITITGRLSSTADIYGYGGNMQNITYPMRVIFIPDLCPCCGEEMLFAYVDYQRAESHCTFHLAGEQEAEEYIAHGGDINWRTVNRIPTLEVEAEEYDPTSPHHGKVRKVAKELVLGGNYGLGHIRFMERLDERAGVRVTAAEAERYITEYHETYPGIRDRFHANIEQPVRMSKMLKNPFGRKFKIRTPISSDRMTDFYAWLPQSTIGDATLKALLNAWNDIKDRNDIHVLANIHDALLFQVCPSALDWFHATYSSWFQFPIYLTETPITLGVSCEIGPNWKDMKEAAGG